MVLSTSLLTNLASHITTALLSHIASAESLTASYSGSQIIAGKPSSI